MGDWFPAPALLITILVTLFSGPWILRKLDQPKKAFALLKYGWPLLVLAIVTEQSFLYFYLNKKVEQQDVVFHKFIEEARKLPKWEKASYIIKCDYEPILLVYSFEVCIFQGNIRDDNNGFNKLLQIAYPAGLLSYVPPSSGRMTWDSSLIFTLNQNGNIIKDIRTVETIEG